jgi:hypothetical protein
LRREKEKEEEERLGNEKELECERWGGKTGFQLKSWFGVDIV